MLIYVSLPSGEPVALTDEPPVFCEYWEKIPCAGVEIWEERKIDRTGEAASASDISWPDGARILALPEEGWAQLCSLEDPVTDWQEILDGNWLQRTADRFYGRPGMVAETDRLIIRELCPADGEALMELYQDEQIRRFVEPLPDTIEEVKQMIAAYIHYMYDFYGYGIWAVEEKKTGKLVGRVGFEPDHEQGVSLGYLLGKNARGKGYGLEMCQGAIRYGTEVLQMEKREIRCRIAPDNLPSMKLARRLNITICPGQVTLL